MVHLDAWNCLTAFAAIYYNSIRIESTLPNKLKLIQILEEAAILKSFKKGFKLWVKLFHIVVLKLLL